MTEQTNHNEAGEVAPSADSPEATDIPISNAPDPKAANPDTNPNAAKTTTAPPKREKPAAAAKAADGEKPAAKAAKKEKPPAVEDKPFSEFIQQYYLPALQKAVAQEGVKDLQISFVKQPVPIKGMEQLGECWQVVGNFADGVRHFNLYFPDEDIQGKKAFSCNEGKRPSTLESFLIDERKTTLDLLVYGLMQRLNGQKWLGRN
ncbi:hypothetical protein CEN45_12715 [Fischerella thermalis CCMEE 5198]|jgi:hypothetical protein|uniref:DUF2996 domain-containing protein n=1 Tax=Fischerella thermalis TaxID=372787 RepID=UPI000C80CC23|nr:DUF2996 domain-containing protein [Fischerella thermalis]PLZ89747.1 hypothetical protein CI594_19435 [Fischerella thermalis CCMEE 5196]PMB22348.1 hypothetical protein CEN45_12715 [Fischerella thermalis CCMEE 5198]PMB54105.1 hypothetical protein CEN39_00625 [Fischerella thermalis CCMEE 5201]